MERPSKDTACEHGSQERKCPDCWEAYWEDEAKDWEAMCDKLAGELEKFEKAEQFRADGKANEWAKAIDEIDSYEALAEYKAMKDREET